MLEDDDDPRETRWRTRPRTAVPAMVKEICRDGELRSTASDILGDLGAAGVGPLMAAARGGRSCKLAAAAEALAEIVCKRQGRARGERVTPAFAPVLAVLSSPDTKRADIALAVIDRIGVHPADRLAAGDRYEHRPDCQARDPLLAASARPLARLLARTTGVHRQRVTAVIGGLQEHASPMASELIRLLDDGDARGEAVTALAGIGPAAAHAAAAIGRMLATSDNAGHRLSAGFALGEIGPPAAVALPQLRARIAEAAASVCASGGPVLPWFLRAASKIGPAPGEQLAAWRAGMAADVRKVLATLRRCDSRDHEGRLVDVMARLPPELGTASIVEVMMDEGRSIQRRAHAATALASVRRTLAGAEAGTQRLLLAREQRRYRVGPQMREEMPTHSEASWRGVADAVAVCDQEAGRPPAAERLPGGSETERNHAMASCLDGRLCGPGPERRAQTLAICCRYAYGRAAPAWCRP